MTLPALATDSSGHWQGGGGIFPLSRSKMTKTSAWTQLARYGIFTHKRQSRRMRESVEIRSDRRSGPRSSTNERQEYRRWKTVDINSTGEKTLHALVPRRSSY